MVAHSRRGLSWVMSRLRWMTVATNVPAGTLIHGGSTASCGSYRHLRLQERCSRSHLRASHSKRRRCKPRCAFCSEAQTLAKWSYELECERQWWRNSESCPWRRSRCTIVITSEAQTSAHSFVSASTLRPVLPFSSFAIRSGSTPWVRRLVTT